MNLWKRTIIFVGILFLFSGTVGVDIYMHTCQKDGTSVSLVFNAFEECEYPDEHLEEEEGCCDSQKKDDNCCDNEEDYFKIKLDFSQDAYHFAFIAIPQDLFQYSFYEFELPSTNEIIPTNYANPPPLDSRQLLIEHQTFLI